MSEKKNEKRSLQRLKAAFDAVALRRPEAPPAVTPPEQQARKYPVFQELAAMKQEIHDEFSKGRLALEDIRLRAESELEALAGGRAPAAAPVPQPPRKPAPLNIERPQPEGTAVVTAAGRRAPWGLILAAAALALAAALFMRYESSGPAAFIQLPPTRAAGLCAAPDGRTLYFADPQRQLLFSLAVPDGRVISVQAFHSPDLKALAYDGASFWSSDGKAVYRHGPEAGYPAAAAYKQAAGAGYLCSDGKSLWAAGEKGGLARYSAGAALSTQAVYSLPDEHITGLSCGGGNLTAFQPESGRLLYYKAGDIGRPEAGPDLRRWLPRKGEVAGFALAGGYAWFVTENPPQLVRIDLKAAGAAR
jgi:hypothetical protein